MKRLALMSAFLVALLTAAGGATATAAQPSPSPPRSLDADTRQVCEQSGKTMEEGVKSFTGELDRAGMAATGGDLAGAERFVKQSGVVLVELAGKLRKDTENARNQELKTAVEDVAKELEALGGGLTGIASLHNLDTAKLEKLAERVSEICGTN